MKVFILLGHPNGNGTLSSRCADVYEREARAAGHEVRRTNLGDMTFDPILHKGYLAIQELEPELKQFQEDVTWCDHFVLIYPLWWASVPALLKGLIDRVWLPGFAFRFMKTADGKSTLGWNKLLKGRTARVIVLLKNNVFLEHFMYGNFTNNIVNAVLRFSGFAVRVTEIGDSENKSEAYISRVEKKIAALGKKAI